MLSTLVRFSLLVCSAAVLYAQPTGYLTSARPGNGFVQYLSIPSYKPIGRTQMPPQAQTTLFSPDGTRVYVLSLGNSNPYTASVAPVQMVSVINASTFAIINSSTLPTGASYSQMTLTPDGKKIY